MLKVGSQRPALISIHNSGLRLRIEAHYSAEGPVPLAYGWLLQWLLQNGPAKALLIGQQLKNVFIQSIATARRQASESMGVNLQLNIGIGGSGARSTLSYSLIAEHNYGEAY